MFPTSSDWDAALGSPGGCEMQGLCQGSDPWAMGAWRWDERCFQRNKKMEKPPPVQWELWAGCCTPSTNGHGHQAGPGWAPAGPQGRGDTCGAPQLPPGHLLLCPWSGLCFPHLWRAPVLGGGCCTPFLCHPPCPRLCEGGLWSQSVSPPTAEWISSPCQRRRVGGVGCWVWESLSRTSEAVSPAAQLPGPSRLF